MRIAHLSDLHFGEEATGQAAILAADIQAQSPDAVVVSGDLTRRAVNREFAAAIAFLEALGAPLLVVPGNHDIPRFDLFERFLNPRQRWLAARPAGYMDVLELPGLRLIGLDSVSRAQWHLDWAAGAISAQRRARLAAALELPSEYPTLVVCHHPLRHPDWAQARRAPRNAENVVALLHAHGVAGVLCGHLHRPGVTRLSASRSSQNIGSSEGTGPLQIIAPSALSPRGTGAPNGWNLITMKDRELHILLREWVGGAWAARPMHPG